MGRAKIVGKEGKQREERPRGRRKAEGRDKEGMYHSRGSSELLLLLLLGVFSPLLLPRSGVPIYS